MDQIVNDRRAKYDWLIRELEALRDNTEYYQGVIAGLRVAQGLCLVHENHEVADAIARACYRYQQERNLPTTQEMG